jgi:hypothetical protein
VELHYENYPWWDCLCQDAFSFFFFSLGKMPLYPLKNTLNIVVEQYGEKIL